MILFQLKRKELERFTHYLKSRFLISEIADCFEETAARYGLLEKPTIPSTILEI